MDEIAIGYNSKTKKCCVIKSVATFNMLKQNFDLYNTRITATNWCGCDEVERTEKILNKKVNWNNGFHYQKAIQGEDHDCGHCYPWTFEFDMIYELTEGE